MKPSDIFGVVVRTLVSAVIGITLASILGIFKFVMGGPRMFLDDNFSDSAIICRRLLSRWSKGLCI